ncbi:MAG: peptide ABC transporter substrate-binding protein, partial [Bdellovibrionales bacterium]
SQEFENLNPLIMSMAATTYMSALVNRGFVVLTPDLKWEPQLAKEIPSLKNGLVKLVDRPDGKKGMIANWEIKEKASWGDGTPVTCKDVEFTWKAGLNENVSVGSRESFENIESIKYEAATPKKCTVTYKIAKWDFFRLMPGALPAHLEQPVLDKFGKQKEGYDKNSNYTKNPTNPGLYNGPYKIAEIKLGSHITFVPNTHFYGQAPKIQKLVFKLIPNTGTMEANLRSGTIDKISPLGLAFDQAVLFDQKVRSETLPYNVKFKEGTTYEHIDLDLSNPILKDIKVRQALIYAVNRDELTKALFEGKQKPAVHNLSPNDPWYTSDPGKVKIYNYSKRSASKLLDEAGWKMGSDGVRVKDGKRLALSFMTTAGNKTRETVQAILQNQWRAVGVEVTIKNEPARVFFSETTRKRQFGGMAMYAWVSSPEQSPRSTLHSEMIPTANNSWSGQNQPGWVNKEVDRMIENLEAEFDPKKRVSLAHNIVKAYTEEAPVIPLYYRAEIAVAPKNLKNYRLSGHLYYETNEAELWTLE